MSEPGKKSQLMGANPKQVFSYTAIICLLVHLVINTYIFEQAVFGSITGAITNTVLRMIMQWILRAYDLVFGCHHRNLTRVFSLGGSTYRVCCQCGTKFPYSWESMRMTKEREGKPRREAVDVRTELVRTTAAGS